MLGLFISVQTVSAHVVVKPSSVNPGAFQTFTVGVPVEKNTPTKEVRLVIPNGLNHVTPNVKPGWKVTTKKDGEIISEIIWSGGSIPAGQRDEFVFSAQVPSATTTLLWKAYQTYVDGTVVAWDKDPKTLKDHEGEPYSETKVLTVESKAPETNVSSVQSSTAFTFSLVALAFSIIAFVTAQKLKKSSKTIV